MEPDNRLFSDSVNQAAGMGLHDDLRISGDQLPDQGGVVRDGAVKRVPAGRDEHIHFVARQNAR